MRSVKKIIHILLFTSTILLLPSISLAWKSPDEILQSIQLPNIPNKRFLLKELGLREGQNARPIIQSVIDNAYKNGGGIVVLPKGTWQSNGPLHLKSRINLHLEEGAHLLFSGTPKDYLPAVKVRWEGTEVFTYSPFIYASNVTDVAITGKGIIDGNEKSPFKAWHKKQQADIDRLRKMGFDGVDVKKRVFTEGTYLRPTLIQFFKAKRILLEDYTTKNSPFWVNHLVYAESATVRNLVVDSHFPNNDGLDIESSQKVLVENCLFRTGDDSVVIKSGRDLDGRTIGIPSKDIVVRNNDMGGEDGIGLGSEMSGGISNVYFLNNTLRKGESAFRFKANLDRGGLVEHIVVRNFQVESFKNLFWFQLNYPSKLGGNFPSTYKDILFENIRVNNVENFLEIHAPPNAPLQNVKFKDIYVEKSQNNFNIENAEAIIFENVNLGNQRIDGQFHWRKNRS